MLRVVWATVLSVLTTCAVRADAVTGTGVFVSLPSLSSNGTVGAAFWDHPSFDGSQMNVGYFLTGTGAFAAACGGNSLCGPIIHISE